MSVDLEIVVVPCLADNYAYVLRSNKNGLTAVVDVPEAAPILTLLGQRNWGLDTIFITHQHPDHILGLPELKAAMGAHVYGAKQDALVIEHLDTLLEGGNKFDWAGFNVEIIDVPGHCETQIAYYLPQAEAVFVADAMFGMGCGACFTGDYELLRESMGKIAALPKQTSVYVGHEYTQMCGNRALKMDPENQAVQDRMAEVDRKRSLNEPTMPTTVELELATNPFLRVGEESLKRGLGMVGASEAEVFRAVRDFRG